MEILESLRKLQLRGENDSVTTLNTTTFSGDEALAEVVYHAEFTLKGAARLAEPLLPLGLKKLGDDTRDSLHEHLESL